MELNTGLRGSLYGVYVHTSSTHDISMSGSTDRRQRKRDRTAAHLSSTAFALFEAQGYDTVSMEQIADEADVAKTTLYKYFPVKEARLIENTHNFRCSRVVLASAVSVSVGLILRNLQDPSELWLSQLSSELWLSQLSSSQFSLPVRFHQRRIATEPFIDLVLKPKTRMRIQFTRRRPGAPSLRCQAS